MRTITHDNAVVYFYEDGDLVGAIDYSDKSDQYIEDAVNNWFDGIMTVETVERHSNWYYVKDDMPSIGVDMSFSGMRNK